MDTAIWDRLVLLPFEVRIPKNQGIPATEVFQRIHAELLGVLRWAVEGAYLWFEGGLEIPAKVRSASTNYRAEMDDVGQFLEARCIQTAEAKCGATHLDVRYVEHCKRPAKRR